MDMTTHEDRAKGQRRHSAFIVFKEHGFVGLYKNKLPQLGIGTRALKFVMVVPDKTWDRYKPPVAEVTVTPQNTVTPEVQILDALSGGTR